MKNECLWGVDIEFKILMRKVKSPLKQATPLQICSVPFLNSPETERGDKFKFTLSPISPALKMPLYHPIELVRLSGTRLDYSDVTC